MFADMDYRAIRGGPRQSYIEGVSPFYPGFRGDTIQQHMRFSFREISPVETSVILRISRYEEAKSLTRGITTSVIAVRDPAAYDAAFYRFERFLVAAPTAPPGG